MALLLRSSTRAFLLVLIPALILIPYLLFAGDEKKSPTLPRDPGNIYGSFENGFKYIIRPHDNPKEKVALYLHVKSG